MHARARFQGKTDISDHIERDLISFVHGVDSGEKRCKSRGDPGRDLPLEIALERDELIVWREGQHQTGHSLSDESISSLMSSRRRCRSPLTSRSSFASAARASRPSAKDDSI